MKSGSRPALLLLGLVLVALNLRPALTSVSPVLESIRQDLGLSRAAAGLLTTIPTLSMGLIAFTTARVGERIGSERGVLWAIVLIGVATAGRAAGDAVAVLYATTLLVGIGIAIGQALLPAVVKGHFAGRAVLVTGLYTVGFNFGAALAAGATVTLQRAFSGSWAPALGVWALLAVPAVIIWLPLVRASPGHTRHRGSPPALSLPWRSRHAWLLSLFFASTSCLYMSTITWLPPLYQEQGMSAERSGLLLTFFASVQVVAALVVPALADRTDDRRPWLSLTILASVVGLTSMAIVPLANPWGFTALAAFGMGGLFPLALTLPLDYAADPGTASRLIGMTLGVGYLLSALGPFGVGALRDATGGYEVPFMSLAALAISCSHWRSYSGRGL